MPQLAGITPANVAIAFVGLSDLLSRLTGVARPAQITCPVHPPVHELVTAVRSLEEQVTE